MSLKFINTKGEALNKIKTLVLKYPHDTNKQNAYALKMRDLVERDQGARFYFINQGIGNYMNDSVRQNDKIVSNELYQYLLANGIKSVDTMGQSGLLISVIMLHQFQAASLGTVPQMPFDSMMFDKIFSFDFHPRQFTNLYYAGNKQAFLKNHPEFEHLQGLEGAIYNDAWVVEDLNPTQIKNLDIAYELIGLPKYAESIKKVAFRNRCELSPGRFSKYKLQSTLSYLCYCETEYDFKEWQKKYKRQSLVK